MKNSIFPIFCYAKSHESKQDAWDKFNEELEYLLSYINGYKYWRTIPRINVDKNYEDDDVTYSVKARVYASLEPLDGHSSVELDKPFPTKLENKLEDITTLVGCKLENRGSKR